jgi:hypothetical protein
MSYARSARQRLKSRRRRWDRTDPWNIANCECGNSFDYGDEELIEVSVAE